MATPVSYTLTARSRKEAIVRAAGSTASGNVIVEIDEALPVGDVIADLRKIEGRIIEKYGDATA